MREVIQERDVLREVVQFPWEKPNKAETQRLATRIQQTLQWEQGLDPCFMEPPGSPENGGFSLQSIARPTALLAMIGRSRSVAKESPVQDRTPQAKELRESLKAELGLKENHRFIVHYTTDLTKVTRLASYIAATACYTFYGIPTVVDFTDLIRAAYASTLGESDELREFRKADMLVVKNILGKHPGMEKVSGPITSLLTKRADFGKVTVFPAVPTGKVHRALVRQQRYPTHEEFYGMIETSSLALAGLDWLFYGNNTHQNMKLDKE